MYRHIFFFIDLYEAQILSKLDNLSKNNNFGYNLF